MSKPIWRGIYESIVQRERREALERAQARAWPSSPDAMLLAFGVALARERAARGLSQRALAQVVETSPDQIADLERGQGNPTLRTVARVAHALCLRPSKLPVRAEAETVARRAEVGPLPIGGGAVRARDPSLLMRSRARETDNGPQPSDNG